MMDKINLVGIFGQEIIGKDVAKQIDEFQGDEIFATINSVGGNIDDAFDVYNALKRSKKRKVCLIEGNCASAATFVMLAFDEIQARFASSIMIHNPLVMGVSGNAEELKKYSEQLKSYQDTFVQLYATRMKKTPEEIEELLKNETSYNAMTALNAGLIDKVIDAPKIDMIFNFAKRVFGLANVQGEINSLAQSQDLNNNKEIKMAEYKEWQEALGDLEAFMGKVSDEALKAEIQGIFDGLKALTMPEETEEEMSAKIEQAVNAVKAEMTKAFEAKFDALKKEQSKMFAQGGFAKPKEDVKALYAKMKPGAERAKYRAEHGDELK